MVGRIFSKINIMSFMRNLYRSSALFFLLTTACVKYDNVGDHNMTILFYNVENLLDIKDDPYKNDDEYTPSGTNKWSNLRYKKKLDDIAKVIYSVNSSDLPEIVGLCEVENESVLQDLISVKRIAQGNYRYIHYDSPDPRGIDCALLYRPEEFKISGHSPVPVRLKDDPDYKTRHILYVSGLAGNNEELHIFINHWPSRNGGVRATEPKRLQAAQVLIDRVTEVREKFPEGHIIIMGDLNDEPGNLSVSGVLKAFNEVDGNYMMKNLMESEYRSGRGSYNYRGDWSMLDNLIVSSGLLDGSGLDCKERQGYVFSRDWMEYARQDGMKVPDRTYGGRNYYGGISDHFPVFFRLQW